MGFGEMLLVRFEEVALGSTRKTLRAPSKARRMSSVKQRSVLPPRVHIDLRVKLVNRHCREVEFSGTARGSICVAPVPALFFRPAARSPVALSQPRSLVSTPPPRSAESAR